MNEQERVIQEMVSQAGHWGVCRQLWGLETFNRMAEMIGMAKGKSCQFRNGYFADGVKQLNPRAITALSIYFGISRETLENLNKELNKA